MEPVNPTDQSSEELFLIAAERGHEADALRYAHEVLAATYPREPGQRYDAHRIVTRRVELLAAEAEVRSIEADIAANLAWKRESRDPAVLKTADQYLVNFHTELGLVKYRVEMLRKGIENELDREAAAGVAATN